MAEHFKKEINEEVVKLKGQIEEFNRLYGQEVKRRAGKTAKKKVLEEILATLERESEAKDRELRVKISKMKAKKESIVVKINNIVKKFHESQRERENKEKKIKELEIEAEAIRSRFQGNEGLWIQMKKLREKKIKLLKRSSSLIPDKETQGESLEALLSTQQEIIEQKKQLLEELSQLTADLEIKELKIQSLQKKISEMSAIFQTDSEIDPENSEIKLKIQQQKEKIQSLQAYLNRDERSLDAISSKACSSCLLF